MANQVDPDTVSGTTLQDSEADAAVAEPGQAAVAEPGQAGQVAQADPAFATDPGHVHEAFHGRTVSWVAVSIIMVGFVGGGLGLVIGPTWPVFWAGCGVVVIGSVLAVFTDMFDDWY